MASNTSRKPSVGDKVDLFITSVESRPNDRFIHFWSQYDTAVSDELEVLMNQFESDHLSGNIANSPTNSVAHGKYCLAKFQEDNKWYRALIVDVGNADATVFFIDYGNTETVSLEHIIGGLSEYFVLPPVAVHCVFADILPRNHGKSWNTNELAVISEKLSYGEFSASVLGKGGSCGTVYTMRLFDGLGSESLLVDSFVNDGIGERYNNTHLNIVSIPKTLLEPRKEYPVYMSYCESPSKFWLQQVSTENLLSELMTNISDHYENHQSKIIQDVDLGTVCAATFTENEAYYRCVVTDINDKCNIQFIDYGNSEKKDRNILHVLEDRFCDIPAQAIECALHGAELIEDIPDFDSLVEVESLKCKIISVTPTGKHIVTLCDTESGKIYPGSSVNETVRKTPVDIGSGIVCRIKSQKMSVGDDVGICISHIDHLGQFHCQHLKDAPLFTTLMADIQKSYSASSAPVINIETGMACIVQCSHDDFLYRGEVLTQVGNDVHVRFVDFGNVEVLPASRLKQIKIEHVAMPAQANQCMMVGFGKDPNTFITHGIDYLTKYESKVPLVARVISFNGTAYEVELFDTRSDEDILINEEIRKLHVICTPPKRHVNNENDNIVTLPRIDQSSVEQIFITAIHSSAQFFGQLMRFSAERLESFQTDINAHIDRSGAVIRHPSPGDYCCARFSADDMWYRAKIISVNDKEIEVFFLEYGNIEKKELSEIAILDSKFSTLPQQGIVCILGELSVSVTKKVLEEVLLEKEVHVCIQSCVGEGVYDVTIAEHRDNHAVLSDLARCSEVLSSVKQSPNQQPPPSRPQTNGRPSPQATVPKAASPPKPAAAPSIKRGPDMDLEYTLPAMQVGMYEDIGVTNVMDPEHFFCKLVSSEEELDALMEKINKYCQSLGPSDGLLGEFGLSVPCLALFSEDELWYRAQITGILSSGKVEVRFVDYGNCERVAKNAIRAVKPEFMTLPKQALHCSLNGVMCNNDSWTERQVQRFTSLVLDKPFKLLVLSIEDAEEMYVVELFQGSKVIAEFYGQATRTLTSQYTKPAPPPRSAKTQIPPGSAKAVEKPKTKSSLPSGSRNTSNAVKSNGPSAQFDKQWASGFDKSHAAGLSKSMSATSASIKYKNISLTASEFVDVCIAYVVSPDEFYCHMVKHCNELEELIDSLNTAYNKVKPGELELNRLVAGIACVAKFSEDATWYRAEILEVKQNRKVLINFVDYGNKEEVEVTELKQLTQEYCSLPAQAVKCSLHNVKPASATWQESDVEKFRELTEDRSLVGQVMNRSNDGCYVIDLNDTDPKAQQNIPEKMIADGNARPAAGNSTSRRSSSASQRSSTHERTPVSDAATPVELLSPVVTNNQTSNVIISYVSDKIKFWVQLEEHRHELDSMMEEIEKTYECLKMSDQPIDNPEVGKACIAPFSEDGGWYRAVIKSVHGRQVKVKYVDYGNSEILNVSKVKKINPQFTELPAQALPCTMKGILPSGSGWSKDARDYLSVICMDKALQCTFLASHNGVYLVYLAHSTGECVEQSLMSKGHARLTSVAGSIGSSSSQSSFSSSRASVKSYKSAQSQQSQNSHQSARSQISAKSNATQSTSASRGKPQDSEDDLKVNSYQDVEVTHIESPREFWCQMMKHRSKLDTMMDAIEETYRNMSDSQNSVSTLTVGQVCMAKFSEDDIFYRAEVKQVLNPTEAVVHFVDYGNTEKANIKRIKTVIDVYSYSELPPQAVLCALSDVPDALTSAAVNRFSELVTEKQLVGLICARNQNNLQLVLMDTSSGVDININKEVLKANQQGEVLAPSPAEPPQKASYPAPPINKGDAQTAYVSHVDSPVKFYVQLAKVEAELESVTESVNAIYSALTEGEKQVNTVYVGMACVALFEDGAWYRAIVLQVTNNGALVNFVDFGNSAEVTKDQMRDITTDLVGIPPFGVECKLSGVKLPSSGCTDELLEKFNAAVNDKELEVCFLSENTPFLVTVSVEGGNILDQLKDVCPGATKPVTNDKTIAFKDFRMPADKTDVYMSHIESPDEFYIQISSDNQELIELTEKIEQLYGAASLADMKLDTAEVGMPCCALYSEDGAWYRAIIRDIQATQANVQFVDYGNSGQVDVSTLKVLSEELMGVAQMSLQCRLANLTPIETGWSDDLIDFFHNLVTDEVIKLEILSSSQGLCMVSLKLDGADVAETLRCKFADKVVAAEVREVGTYTALAVPAGVASVYVSHVDSPDLLYLQLAEKEAELNKMMEEIESIYSSASSSDLNVERAQLGMPCCAKYSEDNSWYRAKIDQIDGTNVKVTFVDYGNHESVEQNDLKSLAPSLSGVCVQALPCQMVGLSQPPTGWPEGLYDKIIEITDQKTLTAEFDTQLTPTGVKLYDGDEDIVKIIQSSYESIMTSNVREEITMLRFEKPQVPSNDEMCYVSHIDSACSFHVQLTREELELQELMDKLASCYENNAGTVLTSAEVGQACCAKYSADQAWYRATVTAIKDTEVTVLFVDYGNAETCHLSDLRAISEELLMRPPFATECCLLACKDSVDISFDALSEMVIDKELSVSYRSQTIPCSVVLFLDGSDVTKALLGGGSVAVSENEQPTVTDEPSQEESAITEHVSQQAGIASGEQNVYVSHIESLTKFYIQLASLEDSLNDLMEKIGGESASTLLEAPAVGQLCCALYDEDGEWYRAKINRIDEDGVHVLFIDYGNTGCVQHENLKSLADDLSLVPAFAVECCLKGVDGEDKDVNLDMFMKLTTDKQLKADMQVDVQPHLVTLTDEEGDLSDRIRCMSEQPQPSEPPERTVQAQAAERGTEESLCSHEADPAIELSSETLDLTSFKKIQFRVGEKEEVYVSYIETPSQFWCQPVKYEAALNELMTELMLSCENHDNSLQAPEQGVICAARNEKDNGWYRAKILSVHESEAEVRLVDYGNVCAVPLSELQNIPVDLLSLPEQAFECVLSGVEALPGGWGDACLTRFEKLVLDKKLLIEVMLIGEDMEDLMPASYIVRLLDMGISVAQVLLDEELAVDSKLPTHMVKNRFLDTSTADKSSILSPPQQQLTRRFTEQELSVGSSLDVYVELPDSPSLFWCKVTSVDTELPLLMDKIQAFYTHTGPDSPVQALANPTPGLPCVALFSGDDNWYRAKVTGVAEGQDEVEVLFVDYGNSEWVSLDKVKVISEEFMVLPLQAFCCQLAGVKCPAGDWDDKAINRFAEMTCDKVLRVDVVCTQAQTVSVQLYHQELSLGRQLVHSGYAIMDQHSQVQIDAPQQEAGAQSKVDPESLADNVDEDDIATLIVNQTIQQVTEDLMSHSDTSMSLADDTFQYIYADFQSEDFVNVSDVAVHDERAVLCCLSDSKDALTQLMNEIHTHCSTEEDAATQPQVGQACLAQYSADQGWYRAIVTHKQDAQCKVKFIDYGNSEFVPNSSIRKTASAFMQLPVQAVFITLKDVTLPLQPDVKEYLEEVTAEKTLKIKIVERNDFNEYEAYMFDPESSEQSLNELIAAKWPSQATDRTDVDASVDSEEANEVLETSFHEVSMHRSSSLGSFADDCDTYEAIKIPTFVSEFKTSSYTEGQTVELHLISASDPDNLICQPVALVEGFFTLMAKISHKYNIGYEFLILPNAHVGQACCAKYSEDESWRRAQITGIPSPEQLQVYFVDYGITEVLSNDHVKPLVEEFGTLPTLAVPCCVAYARPVGETWSEDAGKALMELSVDEEGKSTTITATVVEVEDGDRIVAEMKTSAGVDFQEHLVKKKMAIGSEESPEDNEEDYSFDQDAANEESTVLVIDESNMSDREELVNATDTVLRGESLFESSGNEELPDLPFNSSSGKKETTDEDQADNAKVTTDKDNAVEFKPQCVVVGEKMAVSMSYCVSPSLFWCQATKDNVLKPLMNQLQDYYSIDASPALESVREGQPCCVQGSEDKQWYRAQVQSVYHDVVTVQFVDYGNSETTSLTDSVRPLKEQFNILPPIALRCFMADIDPVQSEWCEESSMFMSQFCEDSLTMQVLEVLDSGECGVVLYDDKAKNVAEDLVFKGLGRVRSGKDENHIKHFADQDSSLEKRLADYVDSFTGTEDESKNDTGNEIGSPSIILVDSETSTEDGDTSHEVATPDGHGTANESTDISCSEENVPSQPQFDEQSGIEE